MVPGHQQKAALALACTITLFARYSANSILADPELHKHPRDLDVVELWAGVQSVTLAARAWGLQAESFDILQNNQNDITTHSGFLKAVALVMRLKPQGLLAMAPVCSSFVFASSSVTLRSKANFAGDEQVPCVVASIPNFSIAKP
jgi:hypothetical protein